MTDARLDLATQCAEVAASLPDIEASSHDAFTTYLRDGRPFARVASRQLEVRLPADIAEAALRTPDTVAGEAPGWVRFAPAGAERHVSDRAEAWFRTAWRHAGVG